MTITKSPVSQCGVYSGLCLPRSKFEICTARRPTTRSVASMTIHLGVTVFAFAIVVDIVFDPRPDDRGKRESIRDFCRKTVMLRHTTKPSSPLEWKDSAYTFTIRGANARHSQSNYLMQGRPAACLRTGKKPVLHRSTL